MVIDDLVAAVAAEDTVIDSAVTFINGVPALIQTAIDKAIAGGATAAQLAPVTAVVADVTAKAAALEAALTANTPPGPQAVATKGGKKRP